MTQLQDAARLVQLGQTPKKERLASSTMNTRSVPYTHQATAYAYGKFAVFSCPVCGARQEIRLPDDGAHGSVSVSIITNCCSRAVVCKICGVVVS